MRVLEKRKLLFKFFLIFLILFIPWSISSSSPSSDSTFVDINTVGLFQTNTCEYSLSSVIFQNLNSQELTILPDLNSKLECHGRINGADYFSGEVKLYIGTNPSIDLLVQTLFWLVIMWLIPKSKKKVFKYSNLSSLVIVILFYIHLMGERNYYEQYFRDFNLELSFDNYWLLSILMVLYLSTVLITDLISPRFYNILNFLPYLFLISGAYNSFNLNIFLIIFSTLGIYSVLERKVNLKFSIFYLILTIFYQLNSINNNVFFDVDKLKGFVNSSQSSLSILFWGVIYYLIITGLIYVVNESREIINLELLKSNFLISGALSVFFGLLSTINSIFSFVTYYYLGLNKFPMSTLTSVEGNTWRGIAPSAEAFGEYYAFVVIFTILLAVYFKLKITNMQIFIILINLFGLYKTNNFAAMSMLIFLGLLLLLQIKTTSRKQTILGIFLILVSGIISLLQVSNFNYEYSSKALIYEGLMVSDIEESLTGDQWGRSAIELANFGEILKLEDPNISSSLLFMTKHYTESNNLKFVPNSVSLISAFSVPINRSEKWGIFIAKYDPGLNELLFGYGPQQLAKYYQENLTVVNTGLVLPHSSLLTYLLFFGILGLSSLFIFLISIIYKHWDEKVFVFSIIYILVNLIKSDSLLYLPNFVLVVLITNFYKFTNKVRDQNNEL